MNRKFLVAVALGFILIINTCKLIGQTRRFVFTNQELNLTQADTVFNSLMPSLTSTRLTSNLTLNKFFSTKLSTYLSEASDLSLSSAYALLDNTDGRLFVGGTVSPWANTNGFARFVFTGGLKANVKDGFASLFEESELNNDIGISLKTTMFGRGSIFYDPSIAVGSQKYQASQKRFFLKNELLNDLEAELTKFKRNQIGLTDSANEVNSFILAQKEEIASQFVDKEAKYIIETNLFNLAHTWWIGLDAYIPVTKSTVKYVNNFSSLDVMSKKYKPYEVNLTYNNLWESHIGYPNGTVLLTVKGTLFYNNSVSSELIKAYNFDKTLKQNQVLDTFYFSQLKSESIYVGNYENFVTPKISARLVYMPFKFIGISASLEKNFGKIDFLNWRFGIPVTLRDSEGNPKINFELVYMRVSDAKTVGVSIGLPIGSAIF